MNIIRPDVHVIDIVHATWVVDHPVAESARVVSLHDPPRWGGRSVDRNIGNVGGSIQERFKIVNHVIAKDRTRALRDAIAVRDNIAGWHCPRSMALEMDVAAAGLTARCKGQINKSY